VPLRLIEEDPDRAIAAIVPLSQMLPTMPAVVLTVEGVRRAGHGRDLGPADVVRAAAGAHLHVRLLDPGGELIGIAEPASAPGALHPSVMLM
jgi:hypothetical protein